MAANQKSNVLPNVINVSFSDKEVSIVRRIKLPFKGSDIDINKLNKARFHDVVGSFQHVIVSALKLRMDACLDMLNRNIDNIIFNDGQQIIFKKNNGNIHQFNVPGYDMMDEAIEILKSGSFEKLEKTHCDQIVKALYWIDKPADRNGFSFGNLISALTEMMMFGDQKVK